MLVHRMVKGVKDSKVLDKIKTRDSDEERIKYLERRIDTINHADRLDRRESDELEELKSELRQLLAKQNTKDEEKFPVGSIIRLNIMGAGPEEVTKRDGTTIWTNKGNIYHETKVRLYEGSSKMKDDWSPEARAKAQACKEVGTNDADDAGVFTSEGVPLDIAYKYGRWDAESGNKKEENPFKVGSPQYNEWLKGYEFTKRFKNKDADDKSFDIRNIEKETIENDNFRKVLFTGNNIQLVLMSLLPNEDIGMEVHKDVDQFFRIDEGNGQLDIQGEGKSAIEDGTSIVIKAGTYHNIIAGDKGLKLYTVYAPPNHPPDRIQKTKAEAKEVEDDWSPEAREAALEARRGNKKPLEKHIKNLQEKVSAGQERKNDIDKRLAEIAANKIAYKKRLAELKGRS